MPPYPLLIESKGIIRVQRCVVAADDLAFSPAGYHADFTGARRQRQTAHRMTRLSDDVPPSHEAQAEVADGEDDSNHENDAADADGGFLISGF